jgi:hypothetical protein
MGDSPPGAAKPTLGVTDTPGSGDIEATDSPKRAQGGASRTAPQDQRDFSEWLPGDMDRFEPLVEAFKRRLRAKLMRRYQGHPDRGAIHLRRSLRSALATGGELVKLHHVKRRQRMPQVVVLVDVSRSMEAHAQFFLRLSRALVEIMKARAFVFHTRLAEVTPLMRQRSKRIQEKVNAVSFGFGGGTRIAHCLDEALDVHLGRSLKRGDLFMVLSDGYDTDPPQGLCEVLAKVKGRGARVCWLHPTVDPPQSAAMVLAAQHVTRFMPVHNLASLSRLPDLNTSLTSARPTTVSMISGPNSPAISLAMSYQQGDDYCYGASGYAAAVKVLGPELANMVRTDLMSFQDLGLTKLVKRRDSLLERYQPIDHPAAREVLAWLQEEYAATTEMVQTQ